MGKPVSFFTCKVFTHFIHCLSLELPPTWNTGKKWQFPINATSSSSSVWTWETLEYNLFRSPLQLHHKPPLAKPWSYKGLVLFSTEQKIRFFFAAWHPAHATRAACRWGTGPTPEHWRCPGAAPRGGHGPPHAAASPAAARPRRSALSPAAAGGERGGGRPPSRACPRPSAVRARVPAYAPRPTAARPGPAAAAPPPPRVPPAHSPRTSRSLRFRHLLASLRGRGCAGALGAAGHVMAPAAILSPRPSERAVLRLGRCRGSACSNSWATRSAASKESRKAEGDRLFWGGRWVIKVSTHSAFSLALSLSLLWGRQLLPLNWP